MKISITGITGLIGSHLIKLLSAPNADGSTNSIKALIRENSIVDHLKAYEDVDYVIGGLEDKESLEQLVEESEVLIHLAHFPGPVKTVDELVKANVNGSFDLLEAAKNAKVKQVIFMSACAVFGSIQPAVEESNPLDESHPVQPSSLYGAIKSSIESFCFFHARNRSFDISILRPVTVYGVRPDLLKSEWFQTVDFLATNYNVDVKGSTKYVSVEAVCQAVTKVLGNKEASGKIYHLIDGHIHNLELGRMISEVVDSFGEVEGVMGEEGVAMSNQAACDLGVEFKGLDGIKEYVKLIHELQNKCGGDRHVENW
ncbi:MAG: NAD(P)-dependent oxidoreductase [Nitrospinaceae bacterium]|nr:NAD(P)-dependent oxidoreductase [Nitrospinaceae bacterium]